MDAKSDLAELVMDHLGRGSGGVVSAALGSAVVGLASIWTAYEDARQRRGNWGGMLGGLRTGSARIEAALPLLRSHGGPGLADLVEFAERQLAFAAVMQDEIVRLQAGESTNV